MEHPAHERQRPRPHAVNSTFEQLLRHDRFILAGGLLLASALSWAWLIAGAGMSFDGIEMTRMSFGESALMDMEMMRAPEWSAPYIFVMFMMWWIMMVAMMLPSAAPVILLAAAINRKADPQRKPYGETSAFAFGYLFGWGLFSALAVLLQWLLVGSGLLSGMLVLKNDIVAAACLIAAGLWQFTPVKNACLRHCRSPVHFLSENRRSGNGGAFVMGLEHGLYCMGCCWFLMLLLFVGGVMNLLWIAGLAVYVWLEKTVPAGSLLGRITGAALIFAGLAVLI